MVEPVHASVAKSAMTASWCSNHFTVWAEAARLQRIEKLDEVEIGVFLDHSWVTAPDDDAEENGCAKQTL